MNKFPNLPFPTRGGDYHVRDGQLHRQPSALEIAQQKAAAEAEPNKRHAPTNAGKNAEPKKGGRAAPRRR